MDTLTPINPINRHANTATGLSKKEAEIPGGLLLQPAGRDTLSLKNHGAPRFGEDAKAQLKSPETGKPVNVEKIAVGTAELVGGLLMAVGGLRHAADALGRHGVPGATRIVEAIDSEGGNIEALADHLIDKLIPDATLRRFIDEAIDIAVPGGLNPLKRGNGNPNGLLEFAEGVLQLVVGSKLIHASLRKIAEGADLHSVVKSIDNGTITHQGLAKDIVDRYAQGNPIVRGLLHEEINNSGSDKP